MNDLANTSSGFGVHLGLFTDRPAPDLPWQSLKMKPLGRMQFQFSHTFLAEEHEQALAELAARMEAIFGLVFKS